MRGGGHDFDDGQHRGPRPWGNAHERGWWAAWTASPARLSIDDVYSVACPSPTVCAMVGTNWVGNPAIGMGGVAQIRNGAGSFTAATTEYTPLPLTALDCATPKGCIAVGGNTLARIVLTKAKHGASVTPNTPASGVHRPGSGGRG